MFFTIGAIGSIASIVGLIYDFYKEKMKIREWILLSLVVVFMITTCFTYNQLNEFKSVRKEAANLIKGWPRRNYLDYESIGDLRGIALSGYGFLERQKEYFPDSFEKVSKFIHDDLDLTGKCEEDTYTDEREKIEEAVLMIIRVISDISGEPYR